MSRIVGACLSQFHNDADNFELLLAHADGREIGHVVSREVAQSIAREITEQTGSATPSDPAATFAEWLNAGTQFAMDAGHVIDVRVTTKDGNKLRLTGGAVSTVS